MRRSVGRWLVAGVAVLGAAACASAAAPPAPQRPPKWWTGTIDPHKKDAGKKAIYGIAVSRDGNTLVTVGTAGLVATWDLRTGKLSRRRDWDDVSTLACPAFVSGDKEIACEVQGGDVVILDGKSLKTRLAIKTGNKPRSLLAASPDGKRLAAASAESVIVWEVATGKVAWEREYYLAKKLAYSPDGKVLAIALDSRQVVLHEASTGREVGRLRNVEERFWGNARQVVFSPDGRFLAMHQLGRECSYVQLWDVAAKKLARLVEWKPSNNGPSLAFSPDGKTVAVACYKERLRLFELATGQQRHAADVKPDYVAFCSGERILWTDTGRTHRVHVARWRLMGAPEPKRLTKDELSKVWDDLGSKDAAVAHEAAAGLLNSPEQAAELLSRLPRLEALTDKQIARLIAGLDSDDLDAREKATDDLKHAGHRVEKTLRAALEKPPSLEVKKRATAILANLTPLRPERLRFLRAVEVLEALGSAGATEQLERLAGGAAGVEETEDARATLARVRKLHK
jgi:hypothetical protein